MGTRVYSEGGGVDITPEVKLMRFAITPTVAAHAARTARAFLRNPEAYPYVHTVQGKDGTVRNDIVRVGWHTPKSETDSTTIWGNYRFQRRHESFVTAAHRLIHFSGGEIPDAVNVYYHGQGILPMHPDYMDYKRSLLLLDAAKKVTVRHRNDIETYATFPVWTGDAYSMQCRNDELTVLHEIDNLNPDNIALYISN